MGAGGVVLLAWLRCSLQGWQAPRWLARSMPRSGRCATGWMWSAVVERMVQMPG